MLLGAMTSWHQGKLFVEHLITFSHDSIQPLAGVFLWSRVAARANGAPRQGAASHPLPEAPTILATCCQAEGRCAAVPLRLLDQEPILDPLARASAGNTGEPSWIRTSDLLIKSQLLYRLSYGPTFGRGYPRGARRARRWAR
jgi:hypothetical protein